MTALQLWTDCQWRHWSRRVVYHGSAVEVARYKAATRALCHAWGWQVPVFGSVQEVRASASRQVCRG